MQVGISLVMDGSWEFHLFGLVVENDLLRLLYLPIKAFATTILKFQQQYVINKFHNKYDCLHWWHSWDQKTSSNESDACIYDWVCKQLFFDPLYLHYPNHCYKTWWCQDKKQERPLNYVICSSQRHWNTGLLSSRASLTSWGQVASLALVGDRSSDGVSIKMPYGVDVLYRPASHPIFSYWLVKTESGFIVRSVELGLGRWTLVVAVISVDAYPFLAFPDLTCHLEDIGISVFWFHAAAW